MKVVQGYVSGTELRAQGGSDRVSAIIEVLPATTYERAKPFFVDSRACPPQALARLNEFFGVLSSRYDTVSAFELPSASVYGQGTVLLRDGVMVRDSALEFLAHNLAPDGSRKTDDDALETEEPEPDVIPGRSLLLKRPWYRNFGHWLVDLMPLPTIVRNAGIGIDRVLIGDVGQGALAGIMQKVLAATLPGVEVVVLRDDRHVRCETLVYVMPVHVPPLFKHPHAIAATVAIARDVFTNGPEANGKRKLYLSRQNAPSRKLTNGDALEAVLDKFGFETVMSEHLSFDEQITLFSQAESIIGIKGAALTNGIFCPPGCKILSISPSQFIDPFFWDLLAPRKLQYSEIFCESDVNGPPSMQDFAVDLGAVEDYLQSVERAQ